MDATGSRYRIEAKVGAGAFGTVYRATMNTEGGLEKAVALKVLHPQHVEAEGELARLRDEARVLARVRHRAVVHVIDLVQLPIGWTLVMEFVEGLDLRTLLLNTAFPPRAALEVIGEVASALHEAWNADNGDGKPLCLVHRDIKPANLKLTPAGEVKVLDFGIAKAAVDDKEARTESGQVLGTLRYMAPERFEGVAGAPSDVYALGVVLMELLGQRSPGPMITEKRAAAVVSAVEHLAGPEMADLLQRMVAPAPADRPTALAVARECRKLAAEAGGAALADWSMDMVPAITEEVTEPIEDDPLVGSTLTASRRIRPPARGFSWIAAGVGLGVVALGIAGAFALGGVMGGSALWLGSSGTVERPWMFERVTRLEGVPPGARSPSMDGSGSIVAWEEGGEVWVQPLGGAPTNVAADLAEPASNPVLSPDGRQVAMRVGDAVQVRGLDGRPASEFAVAADPVAWRGDRLLALGGEPPVLWELRSQGPPRALGSGPGWRGARIDGEDALVDGPEGLARLVAGQLHPLGLEPSAADVTPDGRTLVLSAFDGRVSRVLLADRDRLDAPPRVATQLDGEVTTLMTADGADRVLIGVRRRAARFRLLQLDPARKRVVSERVLPLPVEIDAAGLLPDGDGLMWFEPEGKLAPDARKHSRLVAWRGTLDGEKVERLAAIDSRDLSLSGMDPGHLVQFMSRELAPGRAELLAMRVDRANTPVVLGPIDPALGRTSWVSRDGTRVAVTDPDGRVQVLPVGAATGPPAARGTTGWDVVGWTLDSRGVLAVNEDGRLTRFDADTLDEQPVATGVSDAMAVQGDLWFLQREDGLHALDARTGKEWRVFAFDHDDWVFEPTPSGRAVFVTENRRWTEVYVADLHRP